MEELLLSSDFEKSLENIEQYANNILDENDENKKKTLWIHFQRLMTMLYSNEDTMKRPRETCNKIESNPKKPKLNYVLTKFPDEIWLQIMTYLPTYDIFKSVGLVNKHFNNLTLTSDAIKFLNLKSINDDDAKEKVLKIVKRCKTLTELKLQNCDSPRIITALINQALKSSQNLKSLKVWNKKTVKPHCFRTTIKKFGNKLERIDFRRTHVDQKTMLEISNIKSLKYLTLHSDRLDTFDSELLNHLAESQNQLEEIDFNFMADNSDYSYWYTERMYERCIGSSLNEFIKAKSKTLTHLKLKLYMTYCAKNCVSLKSLALCRNLKYFKGYLHRHDFVHFSEIPKLETLILKCNYDQIHESKFSDVEMITMFQQMDLTSLKHLSIQYKRTSKEFLVDVLERGSFPALERLYFHPYHHPSDNYFDRFNFNFKKVVENLPSLKMVQFGSWCGIGYNQGEYFLQILEDRGILVQFEDSSKQNNLERFLKQEMALEKYQKLKLDSLKWSEIEAAENV